MHSDEDLIDPDEARGSDWESDEASVDPALTLPDEDSDGSSVDPAGGSVCRPATAVDTSESDAPDTSPQPLAPLVDCPTPEAYPAASPQPPSPLSDCPTPSVKGWDDALGAWVPVLPIARRAAAD